MRWEILWRGLGKAAVSTAASVLLLALVGGCNSKGAPCWVSGQVLLDGKPIPDGSLRMLPVGESASPGGASKIVDGKYSIPREKGMLAGKYRVIGAATRSTGKKVKVWQTPGNVPPPQAGAIPPGGEVDEVIQYLPERYGEQSEITIELKPGENKQDFDWKSQ